MNGTRLPSPAVIVGIDGSPPALDAARWAIKDAAHRGLPLRLVCAIKAAHLSAQEYEHNVDHAKASLRQAQTAISGVTDSVRIDTVIVPGPPALALIEQSHEAGLICVGSVGIGRYARSLLGSTATELADKAACPVAIICPPDVHTPTEVNWVAVAVTGEPDRDIVVDHALQEAQLRDAAVLAVGERCENSPSSDIDLDAEVQRWRHRFPDVHIYPIADRANLADCLARHHEPVQLAVIGASETGELMQILGPFEHAHTSVLVVRQ